MTTVCRETVIGADPALPTLLAALDPTRACAALSELLCADHPDTCVALDAIRVIRYKPGRRCLIEYRFRAASSVGPQSSCTWIGKMRRRRSGSTALRLTQTLWNSGFHAASDDRVSIPAPLGVLPPLKLWLQKKIVGEDATPLMSAEAGPELARRIAYAAWKLHRTPIPVTKRHGLRDELHILESCFDQLTRLHPQWGPRLNRLLARAHKICRCAPSQRQCGIHRDFYADQVIVADGRLWLIDFDLYCLGDPGLDIGNFIAHLTEQSLRTSGRPNGLEPVEDAMEERFLQLSGGQLRASVRLYTLLTLMRHIFLSTRHAERRHLTERLLTLCEERAADNGWLMFMRPTTPRPSRSTPRSDTDPGR